MQFTVRVTACLACRHVLGKIVTGGPFGEYRLSGPICSASVDGAHHPMVNDVELDTAMLPARPDGTAAIEGDVAAGPPAAEGRAAEIMGSLAAGMGHLGTTRLVDQLVEYWDSFRWDGPLSLSEVFARVRRDVQLLASITRTQEQAIDAYAELS